MLIFQEKPEKPSPLCDGARGRPPGRGGGPGHVGAIFRSWAFLQRFLGIFIDFLGFLIDFEWILGGFLEDLGGGPSKGFFHTVLEVLGGGFLDSFRGFF